MPIFGSTRNNQLRNEPHVHVCMGACVSVHVYMGACVSMHVCMGVCVSVQVWTA